MGYKWNIFDHWRSELLNILCYRYYYDDMDQKKRRWKKESFIDKILNKIVKDFNSHRFDSTDSKIDIFKPIKFFPDGDRLYAHMVTTDIILKI